MTSQPGVLDGKDPFEYLANRVRARKKIEVSNPSRTRIKHESFLVLDRVVKGKTWPWAVVSGEQKFPNYGTFSGISAKYADR